MPQLPLDVVLRSRCRAAIDVTDALVDSPVVIHENRRIGWCNQLAEHAGIRPGMSEANAHALAGNLQSFVRDTHQEAQALHEAALWALHFTPQVALHSCGFYMEIAASLRLFRGSHAIASQLLSGLLELRLNARIASATTATGAWLRAQCDDLVDIFEDNLLHALDPLPIHVLETAQVHLPTLDGIGCHTLGQLRALPRGGLMRRFGRDLLRELDRAYGEEAEAHRWFEAPDIFEARIELMARVESTEALLFAVRRLLLQLTGWLAARHAAVIGITLLLHHESNRYREHRTTPLTIVLGMPSRDIDHLTLLLRERLTQLELIAPVCEVALTADQLVVQAAPNTELFSTSTSDAESTARWIERLQSRLGMQSVHRLETFADHRPERGIITTTCANPIKRRATKEEGALRRTCARPTWLLPQPLALMTRDHKPFYHSQLTLLTWPERIESGWWDDALAARDYFIAHNNQHQLLWIYRLRTSHETVGSGWFLHGFFG